MSSHLGESPHSPAMHPGISLRRNPPQARLESGTLRAATDDKAPVKQGVCLHRAPAIPASCAGLPRWGSSRSSLSHGPHLLSLPRSPLVFPIPQLCAYFVGSFLVQPSAVALSRHGTAITALCFFKESWEGSQTTDILQIKFLPEQSTDSCLKPWAVGSG